VITEHNGNNFHSGQSDPFVDLGNNIRDDMNSANLITKIGPMEDDKRPLENTNESDPPDICNLEKHVENCRMQYQIKPRYDIEGESTLYLIKNKKNEKNKSTPILTEEFSVDPMENATHQFDYTEDIKKVGKIIKGMNHDKKEI